jgi:FixJ family two-component response regulator
LGSRDSNKQVRHTVCLIDDDDDVRKALSFLLSTHGFVVVDYSSPLGLLGLGAPPACDCIVLDMHMPGMSGLELLNALRKRNVTTPAIVLTGREDSHLRAQAAAAGVAAFSSKPVESDVLVSAVSMAIAHPH